MLSIIFSLHMSSHVFKMMFYKKIVPTLTTIKHKSKHTMISYISSRKLPNSSGLPVEAHQKTTNVAQMGNSCWSSVGIPKYRKETQVIPCLQSLDACTSWYGDCLVLGFTYSISCITSFVISHPLSFDSPHCVSDKWHDDCDSSTHSTQKAAPIHLECVDLWQHQFLPVDWRSGTEDGRVKNNSKANKIKVQKRQEQHKTACPIIASLSVSAWNSISASSQFSQNQSHINFLCVNIGELPRIATHRPAKMRTWQQLQSHTLHAKAVPPTHSSWVHKICQDLGIDSWRFVTRLLIYKVLPMESMHMMIGMLLRGVTILEKNIAYWHSSRVKATKPWNM